VTVSNHARGRRRVGALETGEGVIPQLGRSPAGSNSGCPLHVPGYAGSVHPKLFTNGSPPNGTLAPYRRLST